MIGTVVVTEFIKLRRSVVPWITLAVMLAGPWVLALFMWIIREPERAASLVLLGTKANLAGLEATWPAFGNYVSVLVGAAGMLVLAFVVAHLFGREYADGTAKNMLALPVPRAAFGVAKLVVAACWWLVLVAAALAEALAIGWLMALPGLSTDLGWQMVRATLLGAAASYLLVPVVAWVAVASRNILAPVGFALGMLLLGDVVGHTGWAGWFPWSIVPLLTGMTGDAAPLASTSGLVLAATFAAGLIGTGVQLRLADNP